MSPPTTIPLFSPLELHQGLDLAKPLLAVLDSQRFVLSKQVQKFEEEFATFCAVSFCTSVANGTDALELALRALGITPGDRVITVANAGFYSSTAINLVGAVPVYVDIEPVCLSMSSQAVAAAFDGGSKPKAIILTHLYGQMALETEAIIALADLHGVPVIEDCAQAHGARLAGRPAGSWGILGCFSFYPTKNLGALGDGGAVVTSEPGLKTTLQELRQYGWVTGRKYYVGRPGGRNSRLDEMQAAILIMKLPHLEHWNSQRRQIAHEYAQAWGNFAGEAGESVPLIRMPVPGEDSVVHLQVVRTSHRQALAEHLQKNKIASDVHYPVPDHQQVLWSQRTDFGELPVTEVACQQVLSLPCYPGLKTEAIQRVAQVVKEFLSSRPPEWSAAKSSRLQKAKVSPPEISL